MSVIQNYPADLTLAELQALLHQDEPAIGPIDQIAATKFSGADVTGITFDTAIMIDGPVSVLVAATGGVPPNRIPFVGGQCLISGRAQDLVVYVPLDLDLLARRTVSTMQALGFSPEQAVGIAANINSESGFNPSSVGDNGTAYGLCQWRGPRQTDFQTSQTKALQGSSFRDQLLFIVWELDHTFKTKAGNVFRKTKSVDEATTVFCQKYEIPKDPAAATNQRVAYADKLAQIVGVSTQTLVATVGTSSSVAGAASSVSGASPSVG